MIPNLECLDQRIALSGLIPPTVTEVPVQGALIELSFLNWGGNDDYGPGVFAADAQAVAPYPPFSIIQPYVPTSADFGLLLELDWGGNDAYHLSGDPPILVPHTPLPLVGTPPPAPFDFCSDLNWGGNDD